MNKIPNRQAICDVLMKEVETDKDIVVLCSDSRGSASLAPFAKAYPGQFGEVGRAEQNLVSVSAGLAKCGKKPFAASPACFLSTRSYEQAKVDVAYSNTNVTLVGISGGISYGALGMSHHSAQDIAAMAAVPGMRVYLPSDRFQTACLIRALLKDREAVVRAASQARAVLTVEEHAPFGGLGSMVSQVVAQECPRKVLNLTLPDSPVVTGTSKEVFAYYGLDAQGIARKAMELI